MIIKEDCTACVFVSVVEKPTWLGFDNMGRIEMSDDWWNEREKVSFFFFMIHPSSNVSLDSQLFLTLLVQGVCVLATL